MHPIALLIVHLAAFGAGLLLVLFGLMFAAGPSVQSGERAIMAWLAIGIIGAIASTASLHRRLPADYSVAAKVGIDLLCLIGTAVILLALGVVALVLFNR